jgi:hypothetical protein
MPHYYFRDKVLELTQVPVDNNGKTEDRKQKTKDEHGFVIRNHTNNLLKTSSVNRL